MPHNKKLFLSIELGTTPQEATATLQTIKHAMCNAIMQQVDSTGIASALEQPYCIYQLIYLQAQHTSFAAAGEATA